VKRGGVPPFWVRAHTETATSKHRDVKARTWEHVAGRGLACDREVTAAEEK